MTDAEREAVLEKVGNQMLLCLEQAAEHITAVVFGEKRVALVPRKHEKIRTGVIYEFRLVKVPGRDVWSPPAPPQELTPAELAELEQSV